MIFPFWLFVSGVEASVMSKVVLVCECIARPPHIQSRRCLWSGRVRIVSGCRPERAPNIPLPLLPSQRYVNIGTLWSGRRPAPADRKLYRKWALAPADLTPLHYDTHSTIGCTVTTRLLYRYYGQGWNQLTAPIGINQNRLTIPNENKPSRD